LDDQALVTAALMGDREALAMLITRYRRLVYAVAWRITLDEDDALDAMQNTFLKLLDRLSTYGGRGHFRSWLAAVAAREALDQRRGRARREIVMDPSDLADLSDRSDISSAAGTSGAGWPGGSGGDDPRARLDCEARRARVEAAMTSLSPQQRAIVTLRLTESLKPAEIAERLGLPAVQVRSQMCRAIERLRRMLRENTNTSGTDGSWTAKDTEHEALF
jgi:RNA polymerase sigma-70 factor (ECF subfamily)